MLYREVALGEGYGIHVWATPDALYAILDMPGVAAVLRENVTVHGRYLLLIDPRYNCAKILEDILAMGKTKIDDGDDLGKRSAEPQPPS